MVQNETKEKKKEIAKETSLSDKNAFGNHTNNGLI